MRRVERSEIVDYVTYEDERDAYRAQVLEVKRTRRIHVGEYLTFLFENPTTVRYQVQEMMRTERIVRERDIAHELETYNDLLGAEGELGCTLFIEIEDPDERDVKLRQWLELPDHLYLRLDDGSQVRPRHDPHQRGDDRLSSVQYLKFGVGTQSPVAIGVDLSGLTAETKLTDEQRTALSRDLAD